MQEMEFANTILEIMCIETCGKDNKNKKYITQP